MTLIETLVAMGVMTVFMSVALATTLRGLKLQKQLESQADMVVETCRLAERVRLDCREAVRIEASGAGKFEVMGRDGLLARYTVEENLVRRASPGSVDAAGDRGRKVDGTDRFQTINTSKYLHAPTAL